ncbi:hypothetical protein Trydic_g7528 [Trypoxylus dichotomus]
MCPMSQILKRKTRLRERNSDTEQSNEESDCVQSGGEHYIGYRENKGKVINSMTRRKLSFSARRRLAKQNLLVHLPTRISPRLSKQSLVAGIAS